MTLTIRRPYCRVLIDGREVANRLSVRTSYGLDQRVGTAEIVVPYKPDWAREWSTIEILMGASVTSANIRFWGYILGFDYSLWPKSLSIVGRGPLIKADQGENITEGGITLSPATDEAMVSAILDVFELTDRDIQGTGKNLGTVATDQFLWNEGDTGLSMIGRLDEISLGYRTFDNPGPRVFRRLISAIPSYSPAYTFTEHFDIESGSLSRDPSNIRNRMVVSGYDAGDGPVTETALQANPMVPAPINYRTMSFSSSMIEKAATDDAGDGISCQEIAEWLLEQYNRTVIRVPFRTPRDDLLVPGMTIRVSSSTRLGHSQNYVVQNVSASYDANGGFAQDLMCVGGVGSSAPIIYAPSADFTFTIEVEKVVIAGVEVDIYIVYCQDVSTAQTGQITGRVWSAASGNPTSGTDTTFTTVFTDLSGATVELEVTDSNGQTDTVIKTIESEVPPENFVKRRIYAAAKKNAEAYDLTGWNVATGSSANDVFVTGNGPMWAASPTLMISDSDLKTALTEVALFSGAVNVTSLWAELDVSEARAIAGAADGRIAYTDNAWVTNTVMSGPSSDACLRVAIGHNNPNEFHVLTYNAWYVSYDAGVTWGTVRAAVAGQTFSDITFSHTRNVITSAITAGGAPLEIGETGAAFTFPVLVPAVTNIMAVTADIRKDRFYCYDSLGRTFYTTGDDGLAMTRGADLPSVSAANVKVRGLWRDGNIRELLYFANGTQGLYKSVDGFKTTGGYYQIRQPGVGSSDAASDYYQVGTDALIRATNPSNVLVFHTTGIARRNTNGTYEMINTTSYDTYLWAIAAPSNRNIIYCIGLRTIAGNFLGKSTDGGVTWTDITTYPVNGVNTVDKDDIYRIAVSETDPDHIWIAVNDSGPGQPRYAGIWESLDSGATWTRIYYTDKYDDPATPGVNESENVEITDQYSHSVFASSGDTLGFTAMVSAGYPGGTSDTRMFHVDSITYPTDTVVYGELTDFLRNPWILGITGNPRYWYKISFSVTADNEIRMIDTDAAITDTVYNTELYDPNGNELSLAGINVRASGIGLAWMCNIHAPAYVYWVLLRTVDFGVTWNVVLSFSDYPDTYLFPGRHHQIAYDPNTEDWWINLHTATGHPDAPMVYVLHSSDNGLAWEVEEVDCITLHSQSSSIILVTE